ncbi:hypothetical protein [Terasakiella pusilla]|uniref:hypothetical protein n=1 Tax=Terasakiella pusilla TaxID=64973 RepID=UPI003AA8B0CA
MKKRPEFKADLFVFALILFLLGIAFSMFVIEKDPDARLGLFGISIWILVIVAALFWRKKSAPDEDDDHNPHR